MPSPDKRDNGIAVTIKAVINNISQIRFEKSVICFFIFSPFVKEKTTAIVAVVLDNINILLYIKRRTSRYALNNRADTISLYYIVHHMRSHIITVIYSNILTHIFSPVKQLYCKLDFK